MNIVLYITGEHIEVFRFQRWRAPQHQFINWKALPDFIDQLGSKTRISLILDTLEEELQAEFMPRLYFWEKPQLTRRLQQKQKQKGAWLVKGLWSGIFEKNEMGRKEELFISASTTAGRKLRDLMQQLEDKQAIVTGIYSAPFLLQDLMKSKFRKVIKCHKECRLKGGLLKKPLMLVMRMSPTHYRQCFFHHGQLRLTRIIELDCRQQDQGSAQLIDFLAHEMKIASRFIYNQKILPPGTAFYYVMVDQLDQSLIPHYQQLFAEADAFTFRLPEEQFFFTLDLDEFSKSAPNGFGNSMIAQLCRAQPWRQFYSHPYLQKVNSIHYAREGLKLTTLISAAFIGYFVYAISTSTLDRQLTQVAQQIEQLQEQKQILLAEREGHISAQDTQALVELAQALAQQRKEPSHQALLIELSQFFSQYPRVRLQSIHWQATRPLQQQAYTLTLRGVFYPFSGHYQPLLDQIDELYHGLQQQQDYQQVRWVQKPLSLQADQASNLRPLEGARPMPFAIEIDYRRSGVSHD